MGTVTLTVEHVTIASQLSFAQVRRNLEQGLPSLDRRIVDDLTAGNAAAVQSYDDTGPELSIFLARDHGALLAIAGQQRNAIQYEIGNPLTASKMTRHRLAAGLYAPLRVILYETGPSTCTFEYDKPSSLLGQFGDAQVTQVARGLDAALEAALRKAAGLVASRPIEPKWTARTAAK